MDHVFCTELCLWCTEGFVYRLLLFITFIIYLLFVYLSVVGLDIQDEMGRHEVGHIENSMKVPLHDGYGCRFEGEFSINKVMDLFIYLRLQF